MGDYKDIAVTLNRVVLGLLMLIPGLLKLFVMKPAAIEGMLAGFGFPAAAAFAWFLILAEIATGAAILANFQIKWAAVVPAGILTVAAFLTWNPEAVPNTLLHIAAVTGYLLLAAPEWSS